MGGLSSTCPQALSVVSCAGVCCEGSGGRGSSGESAVPAGAATGWSETLWVDVPIAGATDSPADNNNSECTCCMSCSYPPLVHTAARSPL